jgi:hypothetical protein
MNRLKLLAKHLRPKILKRDVDKPGNGWQLHFHILYILFPPMLLYVEELAASVNEHDSNNRMALGRHVSCFLASVGSYHTGEDDHSRVILVRCSI